MVHMLSFFIATILWLGQGDPAWEQASVGVYAIDTKTQEVLVDQMSDKSLMPASCMKIVTTAAALQLLGAEASFQTDLEYDGVITKDGVLHGHVYIHGGGDPCLGSDRIPPSLAWDKQLEAWVDAIQSLGIQKIEGELIADDSRWERALAVPSWQWEDLGNYYGAGASALSFHENFYSLIFKPNSEVGKDTTIVQTDPPIDSLVFLNDVKTGPIGSGDCACIYGSEFSPIQHVRGTIPKGVSEFAIKGAIPNPPAFCQEALARALKARGITIVKRDLPRKEKRVIFYTTESPTIGKIVHATNQKSINLYAEHLLKKMGEKISGTGSTEAGIQVVSDFWRTQGVDLKGFNMADGSGLSRKNLITAKQLVAILVKMKQSPHFPLFLQSLPEKDSQTGDQFLNHFRYKSGSMSFVRAYAGYAGDIAFAILVNQCTDQEISKKTEQFLSHFHPSAEE
jgi:D-alanyl-D-alanine carboxypeptidase/D-alanyl-D-alanine-endopeptidase (penicillin-binding protein 4)